MCRLFGFRSGAPSSAHRSLLRAENALMTQSREHPDGWGIGWWGSEPEPLLERGAGAAFAEADFSRIARMVSAHGVIAHVRKASVGKIGPENAHPFAWGRWLFAHNGTIPRFDEVRAELEARIDRAFLASVQGETDSERCFALFLTRLATRSDPTANPSFDDVAAALAETVAIVSGLADPGAETPSSTNFLVGDGRLMVACRRSRPLHVSTYKVKCSERGTCPRFSPECEAASDPGDGRVNHCILASEKLTAEDVWFEVPEEGLVGVDAELRLRRGMLSDFGCAPPRRAAG